MSSPLSPAPTVAQAKLKTELSRKSAQDLYRRTTVRPTTLRMLAAGLTRPHAETVEKLVSVGIAPGDWFEPVEHDRDDLSGQPVAATPSSAAVRTLPLFPEASSSPSTPAPASAG